MYEEVYYQSQGLSGMGQIIPPMPAEAMRNVILASVGLVAVSVMFYLLLKKKGPPGGETAK